MSMDIDTNINTEISKQPAKFLSKKTVMISLILIVILLSVASILLTCIVLQYPNVYKGVHINNINVSHLSPGELKSLLEKNYSDSAKSKTIQLKCKNHTENLSYPDIGVSYNIQDILDSAMGVGRSGNIFKRLGDIAASTAKTTNLALKTSFDDAKVYKIIQTLYDKTFIPVKEADTLIQDDRITIRSGHHGENFDKDQVFKELENLIKTNKGGTIDIPIIYTAPSKINIDDYFHQIDKTARDAEIKVEGNNIRIIPEVIGRTIDKTLLVNSLAKLESQENVEVVLPITTVYPKVTEAQITSRLFKDTIVTYSTTFKTRTTNEKNRAVNIKLAVAKINGKILPAGGVFSYNEVVGKRTEEGGFEKAYTYVNGKVVPDTGGGICQVSSTLYNAALLADFEILARKNHMFIVTYVPLGRDAAVYYGQQDFKFRNTTRWPLKIEGTVTKNNVVLFTFKGTNETPPGKTIEFITQQKSETNFTRKIINDPTLPEGKTKIDQIGHKGYVIDTYKVVKINGKMTSQIKLHTSVYRPLEEVIKKGTKKPGTNKAATNKPNTQKPAASTVTPKPTPTPVRQQSSTPKPTIKPTPKPTAPAPTVAPEATPVV